MSTPFNIDPDAPQTQVRQPGQNVPENDNILVDLLNAIFTRGKLMRDIKSREQKALDAGAPPPQNPDMY